MKNRCFDEIHIENLQIHANHGVFPKKTFWDSVFVVSAVLYCDLRKAGKRRLTASAHYGEVSQLLTRFLSDHTYKLIEAAAEHAAEAVLLSFPTVEEIELEIKKPWAPIGLPLDYVSVRIKRGWHEVYIGMGSNMGDKRDSSTGRFPG